MPRRCLPILSGPSRLPCMSRRFRSDSQRIVQRHVQALALGRFLATGHADNALRLTCGWFFRTDVDAQAIRGVTSTSRGFKERPSRTTSCSEASNA